jgi:G3E family GTPase
MTASLARVPCTIVTGFLGAGKTTLIRHLLTHVRGRTLAVVVNEFGDVGIDGEMLKAREPMPLCTFSLLRTIGSRPTPHRTP